MKSSINTMQELKHEWGHTRYLRALATLTTAISEHGNANLPKTQLEEWARSEPDVFELYTAYFMHGVDG